VVVTLTVTLVTGTDYKQLGLNRGLDRSPVRGAFPVGNEEVARADNHYSFDLATMGADRAIRTAIASGAASAWSAVQELHVLASAAERVGARGLEAGLLVGRLGVIRGRGVWDAVGSG
jgi:hypothetical protein